MATQIRFYNNDNRLNDYDISDSHELSSNNNWTHESNYLSDQESYHEFSNENTIFYSYHTDDINKSEPYYLIDSQQEITEVENDQFVSADGLVLYNFSDQSNQNENKTLIKVPSVIDDSSAYSGDDLTPVDMELEDVENNTVIADNSNFKNSTNLNSNSIIVTDNNTDSFNEYEPETISYEFDNKKHLDENFEYSSKFGDNNFTIEDKENEKAISVNLADIKIEILEEVNDSINQYSNNEVYDINIAENIKSQNYLNCCNIGRSKNVIKIENLNSEFTNANYFEYVQPREKIIESNMDILLTPTIEVIPNSFNVLKNVDYNSNQAYGSSKETYDFIQKSKNFQFPQELIEKQLLKESELAKKLNFENVFDTSNNCVIEDILINQSFSKINLFEDINKPNIINTTGSCLMTDSLRVLERIGSLNESKKTLNKKNYDRKKSVIKKNKQNINMCKFKNKSLIIAKKENAESPNVSNLKSKIPYVLLTDILPKKEETKISVLKKNKNLNLPDVKMEEVKKTYPNLSDQVFTSSSFSICNKFNNGGIMQVNTPVVSDNSSGSLKIKLVKKNIKSSNTEYFIHNLNSPVNIDQSEVKKDVKPMNIAFDSIEQKLLIHSKENYLTPMEKSNSICEPLEKEFSSIKQENLPMNNNTYFNCSNCPMYFKSINGLRIHQTATHAGLIYKKPKKIYSKDNIIICKCPVCSKTYRYKKSLEKHLKTHKNEFL